ncbi:hypothetical protein AB0D57_47375, partial [Streptomyces sp. NPDC048275]
MTAPDSLPLHALAAASPELLRAMVRTFADALMSVEADALCGAEYGQVSDERVNHRTATVHAQGSYFPHWLLERRRRAEQALMSVVATADLVGVLVCRPFVALASPWWLLSVLAVGRVGFGRQRPSGAVAEPVADDRVDLAVGVAAEPLPEVVDGADRIGAG